MTIEFNKYQTPLTEENIKKQFTKSKKTGFWTDEDVRWVDTQIRNDIGSIIFLQNLVSKDRRYAKDMPKDENGKIIVDFSNPHILENMDYFRPMAKEFERTGKYTSIKKSHHPMSRYVRFWKEQVVQSLSDMIREDGEWIPGELYWYWNFGLIYQTKVKDKNSKRGSRLLDIPLTQEGAYLWFHYKRKSFDMGQHSGILKARGIGYSIMESFDLARDFILSSDLDTYESKSPIKAYAIADGDEFLIKDGILNKFVEAKTIIGKHTEFPRICKLKDSLSDKHWQMGWKKGDRLMGSRNEIMGVTIKNDPQKARGKRGSKIKWEEVGSMPGFLTAWGIARPSVEDGDIAYGHMTLGGTGGEDMKDFIGLYTAFYEPDILNVYGIPNVYDRKADGKKECSFFYPAYLNRMGCYNHNGTSDVIQALLEIYIKRWQVKQATDPNLYIQAKAELPITPQEAVLRKEGSIFPVNDLRLYLENDIEPDLNKFISAHYVGELKRNSTGVIDWKVSIEHQPIRKYKVPKTADSTGAVEIFVMPQTDSTGEIPWGRYISGIDPYDQDTGTSLGSMFIFDLWTDKIVAEYTGRPRTANEFYENCLRLLQFYNAQANYENNLKGLFVYFDNNNALKYLCNTPQILRDMEYVKGTKIGNSSKGTRANEYVNKYARKLVADWMVQSRKVGEGEDEKTILNLHTIRSIGLIEEALMWTEDGNYDRISAIGMLFILRESLVKHTEASISYDEHGNISLSDPFFTGDYTEEIIQKSLRQSEKVFNDKDFKKHISTRESQGFMDI